MKALEGLKVLDFTTLLPGPYATLVLADLGAEVLKVSSPSKRDIVLEYEPFVEGTDIAANEAWLGRNKRNIFLNLKHPKAIAIVKQLIQEYDIVIEQFRPGVMEKLGLGYEALKAVNPALIYCSLTGYGQTGPMAKAAGHDCNYLARSGNLAMAGYRDAGPAPMNIQIADICVGSMNSVVGILAAVQYRSRTGKGQYIDVAMLDGLIPFNAMDGAGFLVDGGEIWFKTDDTALFTESMPYFDACGFELRYLTSDLHAAGVTPNYISEHEMKFTALGVPIKFARFAKKPGRVELDPVRWVMPGAFARLRKADEADEE